MCGEAAGGMPTTPLDEFNLADVENLDLITASATPAVDRAMDALGHTRLIPLSYNAPFFPLREP